MIGCPAVCTGYCEPDDGAACYSSYDCAEGYECRDEEPYMIATSDPGEADAKKAPVPPGRQDFMVLGTCRLPDVACWADYDCADGQVCEGIDYSCGGAGKGDQAGAPAKPCLPSPGLCVGTPEPPTTTCVISGCSGEICAAEPMASTCEWYSAYECFALTTCGSTGPDGSCGWEPTEAFLTCMDKYAP
jgi:eight-cysteine-cluster-containing protein